MFKRIFVILCLVFFALTLSASAFAENSFVIDVDTLDMTRLNQDDYVAAHLSSQAQGIRVRKYISDSNELAARVRLTITQAETNTVVYDKNYGYVGGTFDSGDIYLPYVDNNVIPYLITLSLEDWTYALPFMQLRPRLVDNSGCTFGPRLSDMNPALGSSWMMGTMLDLDALRLSGQASVALCASNLYQIGEAILTLNNDQLTVNLTFAASADVQVSACPVYVFSNVSDLNASNPAALAQPVYAPGQPIDVTGLPTAFLYVPLTLSYDSTGLSEFTYDPNAADLAEQFSLWNSNLQSGATQNSAGDALAGEVQSADSDASAIDGSEPFPSSWDSSEDQNTEIVITP